ncbi:Glutaredoxin-2, mitochondrial [Seminavis robusta]|uniref:Glutaredoxin-2, mitochondrial n=1 Tax=Seminavis robusta TaxID=568900 RepID=A0A9N8H972_9STRA|nr:Glutaredoxin-2, mitochondrial [Seminavis robusta]|eukprot:Sro109_g054620.1 Glutaredoxin-2, mitochondrial (140) ;mRNA; f:83353-83772
MKCSLFTLAASLLVVSSSAFVPPPSNNNGVKNTALNMSLDDPVAFAKGEIESNDVMVFSKSYCPYCDATKKVFDRMDGVDPKIIELDLDDNGPAIQDALLEITGQRTVPNVFVKGTHIGGNDDTQLAAKMGKIKKMLAE